MLGSSYNGRAALGCQPPSPDASLDSQTSQKFTGQIRDEETRLDYFGARYFSGPEGRFLSPDPLLASGTIYNPQSWNRYIYALDNPLKYIDPTGLYVCDGTDSECASFATALESLRVARDTFTPDTGEYKRLDASIAAYGDEGIDNGVSVTFSNLVGREGITDIQMNEFRGFKVSTETNPNGQDITVTFTRRLTADNFALGMMAVHEGDHVAGGSALARALLMNLGGNASAGVLESLSLNPTVYASERRAYEVTSFAVQGFNRLYNDVPGYQVNGAEIWNHAWRQPDINTSRNSGIEAILSQPPYGGWTKSTRIYTRP